MVIFLSVIKQYGNYAIFSQVNFGRTLPTCGGERFSQKSCKLNGIQKLQGNHPHLCLLFVVSTRKIRVAPKQYLQTIFSNQKKRKQSKFLFIETPFNYCKYSFADTKVSDFLGIIHMRSWLTNKSPGQQNYQDCRIFSPIRPSMVETPPFPFQ